jgi:hypothetical protein
MNRTLRSLTILLALSAFGAMARALAPPPGLEVHGCPQDIMEDFDPGPISAGPLRLVSVACLDFDTSDSVTDPILSPDGTAVAHWHSGATGPIEIVAVERPGRIDIPNRAGFRNLALYGGLPGASPDALAWSADSQSLWSVRQEIATPGSFALGGLEPVAIRRDGTVRALPPLSHPSGPLDGLLWVGREGRALAVFGAGGPYYRPVHEDRAPTLAMVDAARGRVLASVAARSFPGMGRRFDAHGLMISGAVATLLPDGRIRALIRFGRWAERLAGADPNSEPIAHPPLWLAWTEGEAPRQWAFPYPEDHSSHVTLTPDGTKLLVVRPLQPDGVQISCRIPCGGPPPPPPTPVTGSIAELFDFSSGRVLWRLRVRVDRFWNQDLISAVSDDGRFALIPLPPDGGRQPIALVDMGSGRILQTIAPALVGSYGYRTGFTADGQRIWASDGYMMLFFKLDPI